MTERAGDPRTQRTVAVLRETLRESLRDRHLDEISVSELCRLADVRRTTFYTHFASVGDLLTEMLASGIDKLLVLPDTSGMSTLQLIDSFHTAVVDSFLLVTDNRRLFRIGFESNSSASLRRTISVMFVHRMEIALDVWHQNGNAREVDVSAATIFAAGGLAAAVETLSLTDDLDARRWASSIQDQMPPWWPRDE